MSTGCTGTSEKSGFDRYLQMKNSQVFHIVPISKVRFAVNDLPAAHFSDLWDPGLQGLWCLGKATGCGGCHQCQPWCACLDGVLEDDSVVAHS